MKSLRIKSIYQMHEILKSLNYIDFFFIVLMTIISLHTFERCV